MIILYALYICFPMKMVLTSARGISPYRPAELCQKFMSLQRKNCRLPLPCLCMHQMMKKKTGTYAYCKQRYSMDEVLDACRNYFQETGRRITFEYSLVAGVNDSDEDARELSSRIHDINCHVNLIPVNPIIKRSVLTGVLRIRL